MSLLDRLRRIDRRSEKKRILNLFIHNPSPSIRRREIRWIACNAAQSLLFLSCQYNCSLSLFVYIWTFRSYGSRCLPVTSRRKNRRALNRALVFGVNETTDGRRTATERTKMGRKIPMARIMLIQVHTYADIDSWPPLCWIDVFLVPIPFSRASSFFSLFSKYRYLLCSSIFERFLVIITIVRVLYCRCSFASLGFEIRFPVRCPNKYLSAVLFLVDRTYLFVFLNLLTRNKLMLETAASL